jgi:MarR family transcriptional regulator, organic hydroperoxide resistance regulator
MPSNAKSKAKAPLRSPERASGSSFALELSVGYQIRTTHRMLQRHLQMRIEPHGVTLGMWYFLRALWEEDGLTQSELSRRVGTMEPTTLTAIQTMQRKGLVKRIRNKQDRRKLSICLTPKANELRKQLLPIARGVVELATSGFTPADTRKLLGFLSGIQMNLGSELGGEE